MNDEILSTVRHAFGKIVYTHTAQEEASGREISKYNRLKWIGIVLVGSSLAYIIFPNLPVFIGPMLTMFGVLILIIETIFNCSEKGRRHKNAALALLEIRDQYINLVADIMRGEESATISNKRDRLQEKTFIVYKFAPQTNGKDYKNAQKKLRLDGSDKIENEIQTFSDDEINHFLPRELWWVKSD